MHDARVNIMDSLKTIRLDHNVVKELPNEMCERTNLKNVYLHNNEISDLPDDIANTPNIDEVLMSLFVDCLMSSSLSWTIHCQRRFWQLRRRGRRSLSI